MFNLTTLAQILWTSLATSSYYVMFAVAFAMVLKVNGVFNFAQAGLMTIAFYTAHALVAGFATGGATAFLIALGATMGCAWGLERFGFATLRRNQASPMFVFIFTIVASEFIAYCAMLLFGT
jgi:branched-subunit amino acid ABC-type transport system permease component